MPVVVATFVNTSDEVRDDHVVALDVEFLNHNTFGDVALRAEIIKLFALQLEQSRVRIVEACSGQEWRFVMHTLKGAAAAVGAVEIARLAERWEAEGVPHSQSQRDAICAVYDQAQHAFAAASVACVAA